MKLLDLDENKKKVLDHVREKKKLRGSADVLGCKSDATIIGYAETDLAFNAEVQLAKLGFDGEITDLQAWWNENSHVTNPAVVKCLMEYLLVGEKIQETTVIKKAVRDEQKQVVRDSDGQQVFEIDKIIEDTTFRSAPKSIMDISLQLLQNTFGQPELAKVATPLLVAFVQFFSKQEALPDNLYERLLAVAQDFDKIIDQQSFMMKKVS